MFKQIALLSLLLFLSCCSSQEESILTNEALIPADQIKPVKVKVAQKKYADADLQNAVAAEFKPACENCESGVQPDIAIMQIPDEAKSFTTTDIHGDAVHPFDLSKKEDKVAVVVFITTDCPIANALSPEFNRIHETYQTRGVKMTLVHVDPVTTDKIALSHAQDYELKPSVIVDKKHQLVKFTGAETTPEAAVIAPDGKIVYLGKINNRFAAYGDRRRVASEHYLQDAVEAVLSGQPVRLARVPALGCFIPN